MATDIVEELRAVRIYGVDVHHRAADEIEKLRALLVDIDKSGLLCHGMYCYSSEKHLTTLESRGCVCGLDPLQERINAATAAKEEP